ncbi:glycosyltransferases [Candidatus Brocadia sinica JPN1]|uniref:Glycosyltransferases n=1 Tax=Candidatus Brocadia sinica JPN1 TaxID=1197129 RepID=A0ABQ0JWI3_9BACT|nr:glycosyltransferases [Candidatus Brocadia sinica JPN1]GIK14686.1 MAG: hypothetical protein BroJett002_33930 [Candidatus Brocadia sinica]GJQ16373.1 MAG: hypothetical protein HBSIN01_03320 [Candidatus Brocadia sinica]
MHTLRERVWLNSTSAFVLSLDISLTAIGKIPKLPKEENSNSTVPIKAYKPKSCSPRTLAA